MPMLLIMASETLRAIFFHGLVLGNTSCASIPRNLTVPRGSLKCLLVYTDTSRYWFRTSRDASVVIEHKIVVTETRSVGELDLNH